MAFDIDLKNWAINFAIQDRAQFWCRNPWFPDRRVSISWPPSGKEGLKRALQEGVPLYLLAYSHRTTKEMMHAEIMAMAIEEILTGTPMKEVLQTYNLTQAELLRETCHHFAHKGDIH